MTKNQRSCSVWAIDYPRWSISRRQGANVPGEKAGRFCVEHKFEGMRNTVSRACEAPGCVHQPSFGVVGKKRRRFCGLHKQEGMVNVNTKRHCA